MTTIIEEVDASYNSVKVRMTTSDGSRFFLSVTADGISFYSDESSSGCLSGKPIAKTPDDLLKWIGPEGNKKPFQDRAQVKPKKR
jgi:hypothetical protein